MKLNIQKGWRRLLIVFSIAWTGLYLLLWSGGETTGNVLWFIVFGLGVAWGGTFTVEWIARGFMDSDKQVQREDDSRALEDWHKKKSNQSE